MADLGAGLVSRYWTRQNVKPRQLSSEVASRVPGKVGRASRRQVTDLPAQTPVHPYHTGRCQLFDLTSATAVPTTPCSSPQL